MAVLIGWDQRNIVNPAQILLRVLLVVPIFIWAAAVLKIYRWRQIDRPVRGKVMSVLVWVCVVSIVAAQLKDSFTGMGFPDPLIALFEFCALFAALSGFLLAFAITGKRRRILLATVAGLEIFFGLSIPILTFVLTTILLPLAFTTSESASYLSIVGAIALFIRALGYGSIFDGLHRILSSYDAPKSKSFLVDQHGITPGASTPAERSEERISDQETTGAATDTIIDARTVRKEQT